MSETKAPLPRFVESKECHDYPALEQMIQGVHGWGVQGLAVISRERGKTVLFKFASEHEASLFEKQYSCDREGNVITIGEHKCSYIMSQLGMGVQNGFHRVVSDYNALTTGLKQTEIRENTKPVKPSQQYGAHTKILQQHGNKQIQRFKTALKERNNSFPIYEVARIIDKMLQQHWPKIQKDEGRASTLQVLTQIAPNKTALTREEAANAVEKTCAKIPVETSFKIKADVMKHLDEVRVNVKGR